MATRNAQPKLKMFYLKILRDFFGQNLTKFYVKYAIIKIRIINIHFNNSTKYA